jgi:lysophospholipase L1-like esterase
MTREEIGDLLKETYDFPYVFEPFTQFKMAPRQGRYVNVSANGFRYTKDQAPWPPLRSNLNIFLFGGSTTFGAGVQDTETVASYLQQYLATKLNKEVRVYNFGRGDYYSTQERILFQQLLTSGYIPDLALFIDGINDFYGETIEDEPVYSDQLRRSIASGGFDRVDLMSLISATSLARLARSATRLFPQRAAEGNNYDDLTVIDNVINRYLVNKKLIEAISSSFGVKPVFVWQPAPTYKYDLRYHLFLGDGFGTHTYSQYGYERMNKFIRNEQVHNFLWCADIQEGLKEPLYVDNMHYSPKFSQVLAATIADRLVEYVPM